MRIFWVKSGVTYRKNRYDVRAQKSETRKPDMKLSGFKFL